MSEGIQTWGFPNKKYSVVYADPPWQYNTKSPLASKRPESCQQAGGADYYYPTMPTKDIMELPLKTMLKNDSVLFLWATNPFLHEAFHVIDAWGFKYKTTITWHKLRCKGMGYWFRGHTEHLLVASKGNIKPFRSLTHNHIEHCVLKHSEKPQVFRDIIESVTPNMSRIELFARKKYDGWDCWGNEVEPRGFQR